jgi:hypothetical protein
MKLTIYRILSFLLLPMAILFSIGVLLLLGAAFANPTMFIPLFLFTCIAIYTFCALNFLIRGIDSKKYLGRSSKDWIKVNAFGSIIYGLLAIVQGFYAISNPAAIEDLAKQLAQNGGPELKVTEVQLTQYIHGISYFLLVYGFVLIVHIIMSFGYISKYSYLFQNENHN